MSKNYINDVFSDLIKKLVVFGNMQEDKIIRKIRKIYSGKSKERSLAKMTHMLASEAEKLGFSGNILKKYIIYSFLTSENEFSLLCENGFDVQNSSLYSLALRDMEIMLYAAQTDLSEVCSGSLEITEITDYRPVSKAANSDFDAFFDIADPHAMLDKFIEFYKKSGCGILAKYRSFKYDEVQNRLIGIEKTDPITFSDLVGYEYQKQQLIANTEAFAAGRPANNVLLAGARGTGKSSSVKSLANAYFEKGLRIIEISKPQIMYLPPLLTILKKRGRRFIIFIDDLSFDEQEIEYKQMKSILDGGMESKPDNVLFYATSNRIHLIQEKWSDRSGDSEIHKSDTLNEKLSLADRFGLTITYARPTPKEYISMVHALAEKNHLDAPPELLEVEAKKWELSQKGISGRTAKQFINHFMGSVDNI